MKFELSKNEIENILARYVLKSSIDVDVEWKYKTTDKNGIQIMGIEIKTHELLEPGHLC